MDRVLSIIGLAYRANKIYLGEKCLEDFKRIKFLFIANDISIKSKERYLKKCHYYDVKYFDEFSSEQLSKSIGKNNIKIIGIIDDGFKDLILKNL